jgi:hypothetical protein
MKLYQDVKENKVDLSHFIEKWEIMEVMEQGK